VIRLRDSDMTGSSLLTVVGFIGMIATLVHQGCSTSREQRRAAEKQRLDLEIALQAAESKAEALAEQLAEKTAELAALLVDIPQPKDRGFGLV
jgi:hypothetical protein